ncbi:MAG: autotransporter-associated beta strand repeat-containing protein [Burkholderiales bacterium]|nr:autotransporter-associated beta strand repeat-containing protein [Opitutaceae bacterium]
MKSRNSNDHRSLATSLLAAPFTPQSHRFMKNMTSSRVLASMAALTLSAGSLSAAILTYDANLTTSGAQDGAGAGWNVAANPVNWWNGTADVAWSTANTTADTAIFGAGAGTAGATVVVGTVNVGTIQFNSTTSGYTLSTGTITLGTGIVNNNAALGSTISAKISGSGGLAYSGTGTGAVSLSNAAGNDYTGLTTLTGTGRLANGGRNNAFGSFGTASASSLGLDYTQIGTGTGVTFSGGTISEAFIINGSGQSNAGALRFSNNTTLKSLIQLASDSRISGPFSSGNIIDGNIDLQGFTLTITDIQGTINGAIGGTGGLTLNTNSTNPLNLTNVANSFSGNLTINGSAILGAGNNTALGTSTLIFGSGTIRSTDATARTFANTIGAFTGNAIFGATATQIGTLSFTSTTTASLGNSVRTFTTNVDTSFDNGFSSSGTTGGILKAGAATLTLNGVSTYQGVTTVNAGTLLVNGSIGAGAVTVSNSGTTLGGNNGTISGATTINLGSFLAPGASSGTTGTLSFGSSLTLLGTTTLELAGLGGVAGTDFDKLTVGGALNFGGDLNIISVGVFNINQVGSYNLFDTGSIGGNFANVSVGGTSLAYNGSLQQWAATNLGFTYTFALTSGELSVASAIPEPSAFSMLAGLGAIGLVLTRRRQRTSAK